jgi:ABC-type dipeptide/oligopeptide/nickel transport system permease subunit
MNFKPNVLKVIVSLILGVIGGYYRLVMIKTGVVFNSLEMFILPFLIIFIIIYVLWSLMQNKKSVKSR